MRPPIPEVHHAVEADLLDTLRARGVEMASVLLHVGAGTFRPVSDEDPSQHVMHEEWCQVSTETAQQLNAVRARGNAVWAIGTTSPCSLSALAQALVTPGALPGLKPMRALNLDGGNSTALWLRNQSGKETSHPGWSTVRNYLAVIPK